MPTMMSFHCPVGKVDSVKVFNLSPDAGIYYFNAGNPKVYRNALFLREWVEEMTVSSSS